MFYTPRWLWKHWEAGKVMLNVYILLLSLHLFQVAALTMDLDLGIISESEKRLKKKLILDYIYSNLKHHNFWAYRYFFCEMLALMNVVGKMRIEKDHKKPLLA